MQQNNKYTTSGKTEPKKGGAMYPLMNVFFLILLPVISFSEEIIFEHELPGWQLAGKWFIFWAVGIRLFTAGISQASNPGFTARIFKMKTQESFVVIRELGFANISLGVMGILSVINNDWRLLAAVAGCLFFGLAGLQHLFKKPDSRNEWIAMIYDLVVFLFILVFLIVTLFP